MYPTPPIVYRPDLLAVSESRSEVYQQLLLDLPVHFNPDLDAWVVTRHEDLVTILRNPQRFSSLEATKGGPPYPPEVLAILAEGTSRVPTLVDNDPPDHTRFRGLINKAFTPRRIAEREPYIRELANGLIDKFVKDGQADIVEQFSHPLASMVIGAWKVIAPAGPVASTPTTAPPPPARTRLRAWVSSKSTAPFAVALSSRNWSNSARTTCQVRAHG